MADVKSIESLSKVNTTHLAIQKAYALFQAFYLQYYGQSPNFYVTRDGDPSDTSHVDISTGHPDYPDSSRIYVLYHFWAYCRLLNLLDGHVVALALHTPTHLHIQRATATAKAGYYGEVVNPDKSKYGDWTYLFWNDDATLENLRVFYQAFPLILPEEGDKFDGKVPGQPSAKKKIPPIVYIIGLLLLVGVAFYYFYTRSRDDSEETTESLY